MEYASFSNGVSWQFSLNYVGIFNSKISKSVTQNTNASLSQCPLSFMILPFFLFYTKLH